MIARLRLAVSLLLFVVGTAHAQQFAPPTSWHTTVSGETYRRTGASATAACDASNAAWHAANPTQPAPGPCTGGFDNGVYLNLPTQVGTGVYQVEWKSMTYTWNGGTYTLYAYGVCPSGYGNLNAQPPGTVRPSGMCADMVPDAPDVRTQDPRKG